VADRFWIEPPEEWDGPPVDPWVSGPYIAYVLAEDVEHARLTYLAYRDGDDEQALEFIFSGVVSANLDRAEDCAALARIEGRSPKIFRVVGMVS
jgi:hypothetical protein